ncbi:Complex I intermediate-associated protein 30, mitochondrial [Halotydeus destructor]|nr:Complex I intermediate-associated protein 30, mitochondrial [Halotydeus destructor]
MSGRTLLACSRWMRSPASRSFLEKNVHKVMAFEQRRRLFYEPSLKGHYSNEYGQIEAENMTLQDTVKLGLHTFKEECVLLKEEWVYKTRMDPKHLEPGDVDMLYKFDNAKTISEWKTACDSDWNEGFSTCDFRLSKNGHGLFTGYLDAERMPKDGRVNRVGWAHTSAPDARKSFYRYARYDWGNFTHLVMKVRGDGRTYGMLVRAKGFYDISWFDIYAYGIYTHGGPYWQLVKIPFSKFYFTSKGRVQDKQCALNLSDISGYGISIMDRNTGPYSLEIDYIGLENDPSHTEEFAYEMYYVPEAKYPTPTRT